MKNIFNKHSKPELDWSELDTSENDGNPLINAIADEGLGTIQPASGEVIEPSEPLEPMIEETVDLLDVFNAYAPPHHLSESS